VKNVWKYGENDSADHETAKHNPDELAAIIPDDSLSAEEICSGVEYRSSSILLNCSA